VAAVLSLMTRYRGSPRLIFQVLEIAVLDFTTPGKEQYIDLYLAETRTIPTLRPWWLRTSPAYLRLSSWPQSSIL
jgi:hypothetical protein